jgi:iron complex transport system substrate-binding protein
VLACNQSAALHQYHEPVPYPQIAHEFGRTHDLKSLRDIPWLVPVMLGLVATAAMLSVGCGDDDSTAATASTATTTAASATTAASSATTAAATTAATTYPLKVTDLLGRQVEIKAKPTTIVALSPTAVEYVYAVGGTVVGRSQSADFPEAAKSATEVGTAYQPSFEAILALKPDLVIADSVIHAQPDLRQGLEGLGVPVIFAGADSYKGVIDGLTLVGKVLNGNDKAATAIAAINKARDDAKAAIGATRINAVIMIAGRDQTLYAAKSNSYAGDVLTQLGVTNPAADGPESGPGFPGYTTLAPETLLQYDPAYIFTTTPGPASVPRLSTLIPTIPPFKNLKAVTGNKVIELDVELFLEAPGPRIGDAFAAIAKAVKGN